MKQLKDDQPEKRTVELGITDGKRVEIVSGIDKDTKVLVPQLVLGAGAKAGANPFSPMGNRPRGGH